MPQRRMIYMLQLPDVALAPGQPLGTIEGRGTIVPAVNCPKPQFGDRSPLLNCLDCTQCKEVQAHYIVCDYSASPQEQAEMERRRQGMMGPMPQPAPEQQRGAAHHPAVAPPVPPTVYRPEKR